MFKKRWLMVLILTLILLSGCKPKSNIPEDEDEVLPKSIESIEGLEDITITQNQYFHPLQGVEVLNEKDENISYLFEVTGHVNYGKLGEQTLSYKLNYGDESIDKTRKVTVVAGTITRPTITRNQVSQPQVNLEAGSYRVGTASDLTHPINPQFINPELLNQAVPSNGWWTSLLVQNYGGSNGIYTNPLRSSFSNLGAEVTNPGAGFVQYWNPDGFNTMANFSLVLPDMYLKTSTLNEGYQTHVVDYSQSSVSVAMRNVSQPQDHMVLTYNQGSPYIFAEVMNNSNPYINVVPAGASGIEFYNIDGQAVTGTHNGDALIVKYVQKHIGYQTSRPAQVGQPIFGDRFFLISTTEGSSFSINNNRISMNLSDNYFTVAAIQSLSEAQFYHEHAFVKTIKGEVTYEVNHKTSIVETTYHNAIQYLKDDTDTSVQFLLPHHYLNSDVELLDYEFETVRGHLKLMAGNTFKTQLSFYGLLPAMTTPTNGEFSKDTMNDYLADLSLRTRTNDTENFLNDEGPYWNSKAIYPLAQGIIIADQIGNDSMKDDLILRLRYVLSDWYTYSGSADKRYLNYNERWGSVYYSNNDFNTASELSDHAFTHGYLIYASAVLAMYDKSFTTDFGGVVDTLLADYMTPVKGDYNYAYLRSFDAWAGHTWAHGFGTFAEGNNIESSSEAIQSWVGGYLWALQKGDKQLRDAAIYGFVHELSSAKTYMFDYEGVVFKDNYKQYAAVAGMIWGGKYDYATWFGANPTFIYGIQWLPNGEYISNYAVTPEEKTKLAAIYQTYLTAKNNTLDTWFANMWSIQALINPSLAISQFDANKILNDDYPSDLSQTYYLLHGLQTYGSRSSDYIMEIHKHVSSSVYAKDGSVYALVWNPSDSTQTITFHGPNDSTITKTVKANTFVSIKLK
ncbi:glycosyl hydrolase [Acholeplasma manati]|uniref:glucan endo-1,3-beta-D-glucosidase n=1 Tax=Paracholeplasma manati TaxID=591373 RepID=A0ABT2Y3D8_9MOLU|nr:glycosyl hydrolase [Paracholeplasma manati]MCV2231247.1 glycosyl hydrolase [Paracholeplasma manati]